MTIRVLGAGLLMAGCWGFGWSISASHRAEVRMLRQLLAATQEMEWELRYRLTTVPALCRLAAGKTGGPVQDIFRELGQALDSCAVSEVSGCMNGLLSKSPVPRRVNQCLKELGETLGRFDLESQLLGLQALSHRCRELLGETEANAAERMRTYQTLALCAGAALVILFV